MRDISIETIRKSFCALNAWVSDQHFFGWDPFDALSSEVLDGITFNSKFGKRVVTQLHRRNPVNLRPLLGIRKSRNAKGEALFLSSYVALYAFQPTAENRARCDQHASWLFENVDSDEDGIYCWGYPFSWANRSFVAPARFPNAVATSFATQALCAYFSAFSSENPEPVLRGMGRFYTEQLNRLAFFEESICFSYIPGNDRYIHNVNVLVAQSLAEIDAAMGTQYYRPLVEQAVSYTVDHQLPNGAWMYGEDRTEQLVDNLHTGFVLVALKRISELYALQSFQSAIDAGYRFWKDTFLMTNGAARYYPKRDTPLDSHTIGQSILTLLAFREQDPTALARAQDMGVWAAEHMQSDDGYFYYQVSDWFTNKIPFMRWSQAWMHLALVSLIRASSHG
jgi:hypothetical protein